MVRPTIPVAPTTATTSCFDEELDIELKCIRMGPELRSDLVYGKRNYEVCPDDERNENLKGGGHLFFN